MTLIKTSKGDIKLKLHSENTPITVDNFLNYVRSGFYNNTIFHRVIKGFMIQGGGFTENMDSKDTQPPIKSEAALGKENKRGTVAMARTMDPHSATAQFFINVVDNTFLNHTDDSVKGAGYCVFAEVVEGMDVVDAIVKMQTGQKKGHADVPLEAVIIHEITEAE
ncbi:MAG: peptidylprolyl isomerase [Gammaproteobacteria bacterium]|nr:peptidylprolyl isomerase [Gammaproteobacteria bacterium]